jgi:hypothetical protein
MVGPITEGMTHGLRKLHIKELHNLYFSHTDFGVIKYRRIRWEVKEPFGGHGAIWEDNNKTYLAESRVRVWAR